jgi:hypothetical protein
MNFIKSIFDARGKFKDVIWRAPKSRGETHLKVSQSQVAEKWLSGTLSASNSRKGYKVEFEAQGLD